MKKLLRCILLVMMCMAMCYTMAGCGGTSSEIQVTAFNKEIKVDDQVWTPGSTITITKQSNIVIVYTFTLTPISDGNGTIKVGFEMENADYEGTYQNYVDTEVSTTKADRTGFTSTNGIPGTKIYSTITTTGGKGVAQTVCIIINVKTTTSDILNVTLDLSANDSETSITGKQSDSVSMLISKTKLDAPSNVSYNNQNYTLSWDRVANATNYIVYIDEANANGILGRVSAPTTSIKLSLEDYLTKTGGSHRYWVQAVNTDITVFEDSDFSSECTAYIDN